MRIAFLTTEYVTEEEFHGGLANYLYRIVHAMMSRGHDIEVFLLSDRDGDVHHHDVLVHQVQNRSLLFDLFCRLTRYKFKRTCRFLSLSRCLKRHLLTRHSVQPFDIVQASSCFACGLFSTFRPCVPIVTRVSSFEPLFRKFYRRQLNLDQRICEWLELLAIKRSTAAYAPSRLLAGILEKEKGAKTDVLRPPFSLETNHADESAYRMHLPGKKYFLFYGAIGFLKGGEILAQVLPVILKMFPEMHFVFAGSVHEGPAGLDMMDYIWQKAGNFRERIHYLGILRHPQLYPVIEHSHAVVLPSLIDNFPNTMLESMAMGKVVIGTRGTSFEELIEDGVTGILVEPNNPDALLQAMEKVWNMSEKGREDMGTCAKRRIAALAPQTTCLKLERYFQKVIEDR